MSARAIIETATELEDDYLRVREDAEGEWMSGQRYQSWRLVPRQNLIRLYREYGKYGRVNEGVLLDIWTILHDATLKIIVNSETKNGDDWPYGVEPETSIPVPPHQPDTGQAELLLSDPRRIVTRELAAKQIEALKERAWKRWFLFVSDRSGSTTVRNFGETKGNARYSDCSETLLKHLRAGYSAEDNPEERLLAVDRLLNFVHGLGYMAKWLVEGGRATLDEIAEYAPQGITGAGLR